jgi:hypothetical protein
MWHRAIWTVPQLEHLPQEELTMQTRSFLIPALAALGLFFLGLSGLGISSSASAAGLSPASIGHDQTAINGKSSVVRIQWGGWYGPGWGWRGGWGPGWGWRGPGWYGGGWGWRRGWGAPVGIGYGLGYPGWGYRGWGYGGCGYGGCGYGGCGGGCGW